MTDSKVIETPTCKKCGAGKTTDLDGNVKCYHDQKDCPFL
jgi:hypothetical protein